MTRITAVGRLWIAWRSALALALLIGMSSGAYANDVLPGFDCFQSDPANTRFNFSSHPIPADVFGPGSDPFSGVVDLQGLPLPLNRLCPPPSTLCPNDDLSAVDTIVERLQTAVLPTVGSFDTIDIELVELSLTSITPITVTSSGGQFPELWDVDVCESPSGSPPGTMTINRTQTNGGAATWQLPVTPIFTFTRQSDGQVVVLDGALDGITDVLMPPDPFRWQYANFGPSSCRSNFYPPDPFMQFGSLMT